MQITRIVVATAASSSAGDATNGTRVVTAITVYAFRIVVPFMAVTSSSIFAGASIISSLMSRLIYIPQILITAIKALSTSTSVISVTTAAVIS